MIRRGTAKPEKASAEWSLGPAGVGVGMGSEKKCNLAEVDYRMCIHWLRLPEQSAINQTQPGIDNGRNCLSQAWWCTPGFPALGKLRQGHYKL